MLNFKELKDEYLEYCQFQRGLDYKTRKAYKIDLSQFEAYVNDSNEALSKDTIQSYIMSLHKIYKPKTAKRKVAVLKALCSYLFDNEIINENPFSRIHTKYQEPNILPKTVTLSTIQKLLSAAYQSAKQNPQQHMFLRDIAVLELLFATGIRVCELCGLSRKNIDLLDGYIKIYGKGSKERVIQICNTDVITALKAYELAFLNDIESTSAFFINRQHTRLSEQSVRFMINKYTKKADINTHITPHMFRHTFATLLLEEDVDVRYIQQILGHSSITTTQIYTHVTSSKQKDILTNKHPRNKILL